MKNKNLFAVIFGIALLFLAFAPMISAGTSFYFESDSSANSMTVNQGDSLNLIMTASSHNNVPVSNEKLEAIQGTTYLLKSWNEQGTNYGTTYLFTKTYTLNSGILNPGTYTLKFSATTNSGVEYSELTLIIKKSDTTKPIITLNGASTINLELGDSYTELGATATDNIDGDLTSSIKTTGSVNTNVAGTYHIHYNVQDTAGNSATEVIRTIIVFDISINKRPVITILGSNPINVLLDSTYVDAGATAWDAEDGDLTSSIITTGSVNTNVAGTYYVYYNVKDSSGNSAIQKTRTIIVSEENPTSLIITPIKPLNGVTYSDNKMIFEFKSNKKLSKAVYSLDGANEITMTEKGINYNPNDGKKSGLINYYYVSQELTLPNAQHTVTFYATDSLGNQASKSVSFLVNTPTQGFPVITILGSNPINVLLDSTYVDAGATAWDAEDGDLTSSIIPTGSVNTNSVGIYTIQYSVTDSDGNTATETRIVNVVDSNDITPPTITLVKPKQEKTYDTDITFEVKINEAGNIKYSLDGENNITMYQDSSTFVSQELELDEGTHTVIFYATDLVGNMASVTVEFEIEESEDSGSSSETGFYKELYLEQFQPKQPILDLTNEEPTIKELNWFQRFINWICSLFNIKEVY